ncbi:MAG: hypothetical protein MPW15_26910 [Candidatus Manganitrophus sp.]|nr:hypothetical protein [Candidatus Manganitrophus sp.]
MEAAKKVKEQFGGEVPRTMEALRTLPGAGRKTANVIQAQAYGVAEGIAVDTHVKRLARRWGLTNETDPDKIERDLMAILPEEGMGPILIFASSIMEETTAPRGLTITKPAR